MTQTTISVEGNLDATTRGRAIAHGILLAAWDDLRDRLQRAVFGLEELADHLAQRDASPVEVSRVRGKASGAALALGYVREALAVVQR